MFHHLTILNADGSENTAEEVVQDIGGPLCFQGKCLHKFPNELGHSPLVESPGGFLIFRD